MKNIILLSFALACTLAANAQNPVTPGMGGRPSYSKLQQADVKTFTTILASKADKSAVSGKVDTATLSALLKLKADASALAGKADQAALAAKADLASILSLQQAINVSLAMLSSRITEDSMVLASKQILTPAQAAATYQTATQANAKYLQKESQTLKLTGTNRISITGGDTVTIPSQLNVRTATATLQAIGVGATVTAAVTFAAMPSASYSVTATPSGSLTLLGGLTFQGVLAGSQTSTGVTIVLKNTGLLGLSAGGVINVMVLSSN